jgi:magnesium chelatase subunit I
MLTHTHPAAHHHPQEGELRPQLLDRFGMSVNVSTLMDSELRTQMVLDRMSYETDPDAFMVEAAPEQDALTKKLVEARARLSKVKITEELQLLISDICSRLDVDGLRGDLVINRAAKALVAYEGRDRVTAEDIERVISACLNHRCVRGGGGGGNVAGGLHGGQGCGWCVLWGCEVLHLWGRCV